MNYLEDELYEQIGKTTYDIISTDYEVGNKANVNVTFHYTDFPALYEKIGDEINEQYGAVQSEFLMNSILWINLLRTHTIHLHSKENVHRMVVLE